MIWLTIVRGSALLTLVSAIIQIYDSAVREIKPNRIYSSAEAARYLGVDRRTVIKLARNNDLHGKLVDGNYRIPGQSILDYLKR